MSISQNHGNSEVLRIAVTWGIDESVGGVRLITRYIKWYDNEIELVIVMNRLTVVCKLAFD